MTRICISMAGIITLASFAFADEPEWVNVVSNLGGEKWGAYGVT